MRDFSSSNLRTESSVDRNSRDRGGSCKGWKKRAPTMSRRPLVCCETVRHKKPLMAIHVLMMIVTCCRPGRTPAVKARGPDQTNAGCGKRLVTAPPLSATGRAEQNTELRRHSRSEKTNKSIPGSPKWLQCWRLAGPQRGFFEYRYEDFTEEFRRATRALGMRDIVPYPCRHSGA